MNSRPKKGDEITLNLVHNTTLSESSSIHKCSLLPIEKAGSDTPWIFKVIYPAESSARS